MHNYYCFHFFSGFVHVDNIASYLEKLGEDSKKCRKKGFERAVIECNEFLKDPKVSHRYCNLVFSPLNPIILSPNFRIFGHMH